MERMKTEPITVRWSRRDGVTVETTTDFEVRVAAAVREWRDPDAEMAAAHCDDATTMRAILEAAFLATEEPQP